MGDLILFLIFFLYTLCGMQDLDSLSSGIRSQIPTVGEILTTRPPLVI